MVRQEKNLAETIRKEVEAEVGALLRRVLAEQRKTGGIDLEALEMAIGVAMHRARPPR